MEVYAEIIFVYESIMFWWCYTFPSLSLPLCVYKC